MQGITYKRGRGWYHMGSRQPTVGMVVTEIKVNIFNCTNSLFFSGLMTAQAVDPLPLYRDFPDPSQS